MKKFVVAALLLAGLALSGCTSSPSTNSTGTIIQPPITVTPTSQVPTQVAFNIINGTGPLPSDLDRNPETGQNAVPCPTTGAPCPTTEPLVSFNSISGFSTAGTVSIPFVGAIDPNTVSPQTVLVLNTTTQSPAPMTFSVGSDGSGDSIIYLTPTVPLVPNTEYLVIVTNGVLTANDTPLAPNLEVTALQQTTPLINSDGTESTFPGLDLVQASVLEAIRQAYQPLWQIASEITGQPVANIPELFTFGTQPLYSTLQSLASTDPSPVPTVPEPSATLAGPQPCGAPCAPPVATATPVVLPNPVTATSSPNVTQAVSQLAADYLGDTGTPPPSNNIGQIIFGSFSAPNYQNPQGTATSVPGSFSNSVPPAQVGSNQLSFIVCLPPGQGPFPCVIFQHGLGGNNFDVLAIANTLCSLNEGVIAINLQLHGDRSLAGEASGSGFINLQFLRDTRDNIRQTDSDLYTLTNMITSGNAAEPLGLSSAPPQYVGQSLGGIVGTILAATESNIPTAVLNVPGGRLTNLLVNSPELGSSITGGLAAAGIQPGTPTFNQFLYIAQTVVDDADPFNYAPHLGLTPPTVETVNVPRVKPAQRDLAGNSSVSVLMQEMIGDQVIPNSALDDLALAAGVTQVNALQQIAAPPVATVPLTLPLAGGSPIPAQTPTQSTSIPVTLSQATITTSQGAVGSGLYQFQGGQHFFLLGPSSSDPTGILTIEGQEQVATYLGTALENGGTGIIEIPATPTERVEPSSTFTEFLHNPSSLFFFGH